MRMTCTECGAERAGDGKADVTVTGRDSTQLRIGQYGISFRHKATPDSGVSRHWTLIDRHEVHWLRDGPRKSRRTKWSLEIVLTDGTVITAQAASSKTRSAAPEVLETIKRAAREHGIPAALTGELTARMPTARFAQAGLFPNPGTEPGLREWTGTEWSPLLHGDPADGPLGGELATRWSELSRDEQQRHWEDAVRRLRGQRARRRTYRTLSLVSGAGYIAALLLAALLSGPTAPALWIQVAVTMLLLVLAAGMAAFAVAARRARESIPRHTRIAEQARQAALRAGGQDIPSAPDRTWVVAGGKRRELRLDDHEITVREYGRTRWIAWDEVLWFRDGHYPRPSLRRRGGGWALAIVLKDGSIVTPAAAKTHRRRARDVITKAGPAARQHGIPAVLTGTPVREWVHPNPKEFAGPWVDKPGLYPDPGGALGLREWTGAEWLSDLRVDRADSGLKEEDGTLTIWSPLAGEIQRQLWEEAIAAVPRRAKVAGAAAAVAAGFATFAGMLYAPLVDMVLGHGPALAAAGYGGIFLVTCGWARLAAQPVYNARAVARAARTPKDAAMTASRAAAKV
jgi:hypothetical protein